jgi:DNA repair exonuclease SbcCD nuclease subunit
MRVLIYSDPHLGLRRKAHTSLKSSKRLRDALLGKALEACRDKVAEHECEVSICAGDLFDTYSNSEETISEAAEVVRSTTLILAGNHDLENREGSVGSLQLLDHLYPPGKFILNNLTGSESSSVELGSTLFVFVPHAATQELFEKALNDAMEGASAVEGKHRILITHCNYQLSYENIPDTSINLTKEMTDRLLSVFHRILLGHEHQPTEHYGGRVIIVGSTFPTSFSDISDKRCLVYDTETGEVFSQALWMASEGAYTGSASGLINNPQEYAFIDITEDDLLPGETNKLASRLLNESACAVRLSMAGDGKITAGDVDKAALKTLPEIISADLEQQDKELHALWEELTNA